jgi:hypothetical protein
MGMNMFGNRGSHLGELALDSFIQEQIRQCKKIEKNLNQFGILRSISLNGLLIRVYSSSSFL